jgi:cobalt-zinc-cadmium efflux system outer membrane protein
MADTTVRNRTIRTGRTYIVRAASIIALSLLAAVVGCRSTRPQLTQLGSDRQDLQVVSAALLPSQAPSQGDATILTAAHVEEVSALRNPAADHSPQELLPRTMPTAEGDRTLTLSEFEEIALQNNPTLAAAAARMSAAEGRQLQAGLLPNPQLGYHAMEMGNLGTAGQQGGFIRQRIVTGGKLRLDRQIAGTEVDERHFQLHAQQQRVLSDLRSRFYATLVAQRRVELTQELGAIADDLVRSTRLLLEGRQTSENTFLQAEIEAEESHILLENARNDSGQAWRRLAAVAGLPTVESTRLTGDISGDVAQYEWEDAYAMVLDANPELAAARARAERSRLVITRARREVVPDLDVMVSLRHINPTSSDTTSVLAGMPIPIFDRNQGNVMRAQAEAVAAEREVARIELDIQDRLAVTFRRYANARHQAERYKSRILPRAQRSLDLVRNAYQEGRVEYLTLINSQQKFIRVNLAYLDSVGELWDSVAKLEGQLLTHSLAAPAER